VRSELITAVALYGTKTGDLRSLLEAVQAMIGERLGGSFRPYTLDQIHTTVIRLDGAADQSAGFIVNQRDLEVTGIARPADHARALKILSANLTPPLRMRIGGYRPDVPAMFTSRGQHPHERSFSVQGAAFVLMGWPVATAVNGGSVRPLDDLRRSMAEANIRHWYHQSATDVDNDFHLVVGHHDGAAERDTTAAVQAVRAYLAEHSVEAGVGVEQVSVIASDSPTLAPARYIGRLPVDPAQIAGLYR
jgi:hypothetical protein